MIVSSVIADREVVVPHDGSRLRRHLHALLLTFAVAAFALGAMRLYTQTALEGEFNHYILASTLFGTPTSIAAHGVEPLYRDGKIAGWDGQFYYYIANDPFARRDTPAHIDATAYRYQRIGLPLLSWIASKASGQPWVSPSLYYSCGLAVVLLATYYGSLLFASRGRAPWLIALWSLSMGVQGTLLNGLPDAAADGFLLIAIASLVWKRPFLYSVAAALACLTREAYVIFACSVAWFSFIEALSATRAERPDTSFLERSAVAAGRWFSGAGWLRTAPIAAFIGWQMFVRWRFQVSPSSQATGILAPPLSSFYRSLARGLASQESMFSHGSPNRLEFAALALFALVMALSATAACRVFFARDDAERWNRPVAAATLVLVALYACFGDVVMASHLNFLKASGVLIFVPLLLWRKGERTSFRWAVAALLCGEVLFAYVFVKERIHPGFVDYDNFTNASIAPQSTPLACRHDLSARLALVGIEQNRYDWLSRALLGRPATIMRVAITNTSTEPFTSAPVKGGVAIAGIWLDERGELSRDGLRSYIPGGLAPGQTATIPVVVEYPKAGRSTLRISLVQEFCAWFYAIDGSSKLDFPYLVR